MKDLLIILLLLGLLWGGYQGMVYLGSLGQSDTTEAESIRHPLAENSENSEKRLNQSAIKEMKKIQPEVKEKEKPVTKKAEVISSAQEKTNGQKAMDAVRDDTRLDIEGKPRSKEDFYKELNSSEETPPYERLDAPAEKKEKAPTTNETDIKEQKAAMAEKGKALAGEFSTKGASEKKSKTRTTFNIEKGETETVPADDLPQEYEQPAEIFTPSKYILVAGSYASADNAVKEVMRLKKQGFPKASIVLSEKNLNLVSLGTFSDRAAANAQAAEIKKAGIDLFVKGIR